MSPKRPLNLNPRRLMGLLTVLLLAAPAPAQEQPPQQQPAQERPLQEPPLPGPARTRNGNQDPGVQRQDGGLVLDFRDANINVVLDELSEAAGFIVVREARPEGRVTLTSRQPVSPEDAVTLLNTVLHNNGYAAIRQGRILKIVERDRARHLNIPVRSGRDPEEVELSDELITQVIPLRHADATQLRQDLAPVVNPEADFTANASSNALVITDTSANVRRIVEIIAALDTTLAESVEVKVFQLQYANASNAATLINNVFGSLEVGRGDAQAGGDPREMFMRMMQQQQRGGRGQQQQQAARGSRINAAADERTNSLVVTGPGDTLEIVETVVRQLDENPVADETVFVYRLRNAQALNVEQVVNNLFGTGTTIGRGGQQQQQLQRRTGQAGRGGGAGGGRGGGPGRAGTGTFGGVQGGGLTQQQQQRMQVQQQRGGAAAARLSPGARQAAGDLAGQVTIIADPDTNSLLVRTSPTNYERVRAILQELDRPVAQVLIKVLIAEVTHDTGSDIGAEFSILNLRAGGLGQTAGTNFNIPVTGAAATGLVVQVLEQDFNAAIRALETAGKLDVLSRPYILASDNQLASITVGQEVPFIINSRITDTGGIINTIDYRDIGILLDVIPHINPDGLVILDVAPEISTLTGTTVPISELVNAPVIAKRAAVSRVGVRNGQTIVIGGLMEDRRTQTINRVPILGSIPLIGNAFRRTQSTKVKTELLIFLTPHVASDPDQLPDMAQDELDGTDLVPRAVAPGAFRRHMEGMQRGATESPEAPPQESGPIQPGTRAPDRTEDDPLAPPPGPTQRRPPPGEPAAGTPEQE